MSTYCFKRGNYYYYRRRVPDYVSDLDRREEILLSMRTKDEREGIRRAAIHNDFIEEYWRKLIAGGDDIDPQAEYRLAVKRAKAMGFIYKSATDISLSPLAEIIDRTVILEDKLYDEEIVSTVCGTVKEPDILLNECIDKYWPLCSHKLVNKSEDQVRKWKNPRALAVKTLLNVIGNKPIYELTRSDIIKYRQWWLGRISNGDAVSSTANKNLIYLKEVLKEVALSCEIKLDIESLFVDLKLKQSTNSRPSFEAEYVQEAFLKGSELCGLNKEARMLIYAMCDTGARISELIGLRAEDIDLKGEIPHIWIRPYEKHALKTPQSERKIPLVGVSLYAFKELGSGFIHYTNPDTASSTVNKYLRENDLKPTSRHQLYSLRHTFKDRLRDVSAPEEIIDELMGHKKSGPKYGRGHLLEKKYEWLKKIAFDASSI
ncbi:MAG: DUF6538 domain-containing protein [Alphaproteobacteria bacterium]